MPKKESSNSLAGRPAVEPLVHSPSHPHRGGERWGRGKPGAGGGVGVGGELLAKFSVERERHLGPSSPHSFFTWLSEE